MVKNYDGRLFCLRAPSTVTPTNIPNSCIHKSWSRKTKAYSLEVAEDRNQGTYCSHKWRERHSKSNRATEEARPTSLEHHWNTHADARSKGTQSKACKYQRGVSPKRLVRYARLLPFLVFPEQHTAQAAESCGLIKFKCQRIELTAERAAVNLGRKLRKKEKMHREVRPLILGSTLPNFFLTANYSGTGKIHQAPAYQRESQKLKN